MSEHLTREQLDAAAKVELEKINALPKPLKPKDKTAIPAQPMPQLEPSYRARVMEEVAQGYTEAQAIVNRCLNCKKPFCVESCPVHIDIPAFIAKIAEGDFKAAIAKIKETSLLPAICGRVCPQERQCQMNCTMGKMHKDVNQAVAIGRLERFAADYERNNGGATVPAVKPATGKKVAVIGSGPAGLVVAADVRREGHDVTIFEAFHKLGGVVRYGIPEFRLPKKIVDKEIESLAAMGVKFETNFVIGRTRKLKDLIEKDGFDAVFVGTGAGLPLFMNIEGENLVGVFAANEYLTRANLMRAYDKENADTPMWPGKNVVVLGGGNVAMDAARMALRLGAEKVRIIYRRSMNELPARKEEVLHAQEEGVEFCVLQNPAMATKPVTSVACSSTSTNSANPTKRAVRVRSRSKAQASKSNATPCSLLLVTVPTRLSATPLRNSPSTRRVTSFSKMQPPTRPLWKRSTPVVTSCSALQP